MKCETLSRRKFIAVSVVAGAAVLTEKKTARSSGRGKRMKTVTILHTNDMHSCLYRVRPVLGLHSIHAERRQDPGRVCAAGRADCKAGGRRAMARALYWCLTRATTAWGRRSALPPARPAANCNSCGSGLQREQFRQP